MSNIQSLNINRATAIEGMHERIQDVKSALEQRINLSEYSENIQTVVTSVDAANFKEDFLKNVEIYKIKEGKLEK